MRDYEAFLQEVTEAIDNCEGSELKTTVNEIINKYIEYSEKNIVPANKAKLINYLVELINEVDGSELERELKKFSNEAR